MTHDTFVRGADAPKHASNIFGYFLLPNSFPSHDASFAVQHSYRTHEWWHKRIL